MRKAEAFLKKITSGKSKNWYENTLLALGRDISQDKRSLLQAKVDEYEKKVSSTKEWISRLESWIDDGYESCCEIKRKIWDVESKISDGASKL